MKLYAAIVLLVTLSAAQAEGECFCYPDQMSGEILLHDRTFNHFNIDYNRNMIVEVYKAGKIVYDLEAGKMHRFSLDGSCKTIVLPNPDNYAQCMPDDAVMFWDEHDSVTYDYMIIDGTVEVIKTLSKDTCVPIQATKFKGDKVVTLEYKAYPLADETAFDVDLSHCTE